MTRKDLEGLSNSEVVDVLQIVMDDLKVRVFDSLPNSPVKVAVKKITNTDSLTWI